jgi:hypothetical protein
MRVIQNGSIGLELNFYDKNTSCDKGMSEKNEFSQKTTLGLKSKSVFSTYFSIEKSNSKNNFCIITLV